MLNCSGDPLENYLKPFGYSVVLLPRTNIMPLQLAAVKASRRLESIGDMADVFAINSVPLPAVASGTSTNLSGMRSGSLKVGVGLKLLDGAFAAIGIPPMGITAAFGDAARVSFAFEKVSIDAAKFIDLDRFLADASLVGDAPSVKAMLEADSVYAILEVLRAETIIINAENERGGDVAVDLSAIKAVVGANASVKAERGGTSRLELTSPVPLAFGVKAVRIFVSDGRVSTLQLSKAGEVALESNTLSAPNSDPVPLDSDIVMAS